MQRVTFLQDSLACTRGQLPADQEPLVHQSRVLEIRCANTVLSAISLVAISLNQVAKSTKSAITKLGCQHSILYDNNGVFSDASLSWYGPASGCSPCFTTQRVCVGIGQRTLRSEFASELGSCCCARETSWRRRA